MFLPPRRNLGGYSFGTASEYGCFGRVAGVASRAVLESLEAWLLEQMPAWLLDLTVSL